MTLLKPPIYIFTDFDGTIMRNDLGDALFMEFGDFAQYHPRLEAGELSVPQYWKLLVASLRSGLTPEDIQSWALRQSADESFQPFVEFCRERGLTLAVVSDGFDVYIHPILERENATDIPRFCNRLLFDNGVFTPLFPGRDEACSCFCASCKRNAFLRFAPPEALIVYIGDGYSDFCAAEHADIIFAKKSLAAHCNRLRLPHYPFSSFSDVQHILVQLLTRRRLKYRHQAVLRRKEAFEVE
jgi:2,3-diketo-5-methylthio-1-phosphopentane phosphatase